MAYLDDHPPRRAQFRCPRRAALSGVIVVHTAENSPDWSPPDTGAEAVAKFIQGRSDPGSYHDLVDSDTIINLVRYDCEAYHDGTGSNPHSLGLSVATTAARWPSMPAAWATAAVVNAARAAAEMAWHVRARTGIVVPARRITRGESELRMPGFISHAERDPARRTDPGAGFPWGLFLAEYARLTGPTPQPPTPSLPVEDLMPFPVVSGPGGRSPRNYAALLPGLVVKFTPTQIAVGSQERWAPSAEYHAGVKAGLYLPVEVLDDGDYDQAVAAAKRLVLPTSG